jgi:hypothetical protein
VRVAIPSGIRNLFSHQNRLDDKLPNCDLTVMAATFFTKFRSLVDEFGSLGIVPAITAEGVRQTPIFGSNRMRESHSADVETVSKHSQEMRFAGGQGSR